MYDDWPEPIFFILDNAWWLAAIILLLIGAVLKKAGIEWKINESDDEKFRRLLQEGKDPKEKDDLLRR